MKMKEWLKYGNVSLESREELAKFLLHTREFPMEKGQIRFYLLNPEKNRYEKKHLFYNGNFTFTLKNARDRKNMKKTPELP